VIRQTLFLATTFLLAACGGQPPRPAAEAPPAESPAVPPAPTFGKGGGYYLDDGPLASVPVDLAALPDAVPRREPLHRFANRPYSVLGKDYVPMQSIGSFRQAGVASWYGRRYHGQKTSSGEPYDMFAMTAAHPTLPIPSYVRVTRTNGGPDAGKAVVVRVNDRGPFLHDRVIDLSYAAAWKLGIVEKGSGSVIVETVLPGETTPAPVLAEAPQVQPVAAVAAEKPRVLDDVVEGGGHYLQLGAFGSRDNAEALRGKLARTLGDLGERLQIRSAGSLHRLQLGPWPDADAARRIAEQLKAAFDLPSVPVK
jgi:rare lipoprotein A